MSLVRPGQESVTQKGDKNVNRHACCNQRAPTSLNYWVGQKVCLRLKKKKKRKNPKELFGQPDIFLYIKLRNIQLNKGLHS